MRILICGDRNWSDRKVIEQVIISFPPETIIIHGGCRGADLIAACWAKVYGLDVIEFPADWKKHGKAAGPIRNQQMLDEGKPEEVWAFHPDISKSKGTKDMVNRARKAGILVEMVTQ